MLRLHDSFQAAFLAKYWSGVKPLPVLLLNQALHAILNSLKGCPFRYSAARVFKIVISALVLGLAGVRLVASEADWEIVARVGDSTRTDGDPARCCGVGLFSGAEKSLEPPGELS